MNNEDALREMAAGLIQEVQYWRGLLALALKANGGTLTVKKSEVDVESPFEVVMKRIDDKSDVANPEIQFKLLEGQEEIESVLGKPSPIIIPK